MPNLLGLPPAATQAVPLAPAVLAHLGAHYPDMDTHLWERDAEAWAAARGALVAPALDTDACVRYAAHLAWLERVLGATAGVEFPWALNGGKMVGDARLGVERGYVLYRLAVHHAERGAHETRGSSESLKCAAAAFQVAAGLVARAAAAAPVLHALAACLGPLLLAQAQECFWQKAVQDRFKDTTIAKLATAVSELYGASAAHAAAAPLPPGWAAHIAVKQHHFAAAAAYRKSCDDLAARRYADELSRLQLAAASVRAAHAHARRTLPLPAVADDLRTLERMIETNLARADRDNQLIYLQVPTSASQLPPLDAAVMVKEVPPHELDEPVKLLRTHGEPLWFARLLTYGIDAAVRLYHDRQSELLHGTLEARAAELAAKLQAQLEVMRLKETLERLETPRQWSPAWATYIHMAQARPLARLHEQLADVDALARACRRLLDEARSVLWSTTAPDAVALRPLWEEHERMAAQAAASDAAVRRKLEAAEPVLHALERGAAALQTWLTPVVSGLERTRAAHAHDVRALRLQVEQLEDLGKARQKIVWRAQAAMEHDDIRPRLLDAARARHLLAGDQGPTDAAPLHPVDRAALDDVLQDALAHYDVYAAQLDAHGDKEAELLAALKHGLARLLREPQVADALDDQADAWRQIDAAHALAEEVVANAHEGHTFYERLHALLEQLYNDARDVARAQAYDGRPIHFDS